MHRLAFLIACTFFLLSLPVAVAAQIPTAPTLPQTGKVVVVYLHALNNSYNPTFDTGGQTIGGLSSKQLGEKFVRGSAATIINFVVENGYRVVGFSAKQAEVFNGNGGGSAGYVVLLERTP